MVKIVSSLVLLVTLLYSCVQPNGVNVYSTSHFCNGADTYFIDFDTRKVVNITRYNNFCLDTSYGMIKEDYYYGDYFVMKDKTPIHNELVHTADCDNKYIYIPPISPDSIVDFDYVTKKQLVLFSDVPWMTYYRVNNYRGKIKFNTQE